MPAWVFEHMFRLRPSTTRLDSLRPVFRNLLNEILVVTAAVSGGNCHGLPARFTLEFFRACVRHPHLNLSEATLAHGNPVPGNAIPYAHGSMLHVTRPQRGDLFPSRFESRGQTNSLDLDPGHVKEGLETNAELAMFKLAKRIAPEPGTGVHHDAAGPDEPAPRATAS